MTEFGLIKARAEQGDVASQYYLGLRYYKGDGVKQDYAKAALWWAKAAGQGEATAQFRLGVMYAQGEGVAQNNTVALHLFYNALGNSHPDARYWIQKLTKTP